MEKRYHFHSIRVNNIMSKGNIVLTNVIQRRSVPQIDDRGTGHLHFLFFVFFFFHNYIDRSISTELADDVSMKTERTKQEEEQSGEKRRQTRSISLKRGMLFAG